MMGLLYSWSSYWIRQSQSDKAVLPLGPSPREGRFERYLYLLGRDRPDAIKRRSLAVGRTSRLTIRDIEVSKMYPPL